MKTTTLKTFSTMLLGLIMNAALLKAQIVYTNLDPDLTVNSNFGSYLLDLNHDGVNDFSLVITMVTQPFSQNTITLYPLNGSEYADASFVSASYPFVFHLNDVINSGLSWEANQHTVVSATRPGNDWIISGTCNGCIYYAGLRLHLGDLTYYGWAQIKVVADPSGATFVIYDYACNSLPFQSILAGEKSCTAPSVVANAGGPLTFCKGSNVSLAATTSSYNFQWKKNGAAIIGATSLNFSVTESGTYSIDVSNSCGSVSSGEYVVTVNPKPQAVIIPSGTVNMCSGDAIALIANSSNGLTYQWKKNGIDIPAATNSAVAVNSAGKYKVVVTKTATGCSKTSKVTVVNISCKLSTGEGTSNGLIVSPNPISESAVISLQLATDEHVTLKIYDLTGRVIRTLEDEYMNAGTREVAWDARDENGNDLSTGIYLLQMQTESENETIRLSVVK